MQCLDENAVADFVEGRLSPSLRSEVLEHLDGCDVCRQLVACTSEALLPTGTASLGVATTAEDLKHLARGTRIDRYRVLDVVGAGAMGVVYAAEDTVLRRSVALKVVRSEQGKPQDPLRTRLLREARAACAVRHPNVVPVHDVLELEDGSPVLVMDLLSGETLRARLDRDRVLSVAQTANVFVPVLSALESAHALGVVHRDLKPENIFLCTSPEGSLDVRIVDFGVAKLLVKEAGAADTAGLTETGAVVGTPYYMSPEQAFGEKDIDGRADLWAVGVMLYECLAATRPTEARNVGQVLKILAHLQFSPLREVSAGLPESILSLVDDLLCERERRLPSASLARSRLEALRDCSSVSLSPPAAASHSLPAPVKPQGTMIAAGVVGLLIVAAGVGWFAWGRTSTRVQAGPEPVLSALTTNVAPTGSEPTLSLPSALASAAPALSLLQRPPTKPKERQLDAGTTPSAAPATPTATSSAGPGHLLVVPPF